MAIIVKGLPNQYKTFSAVWKQKDRECEFIKVCTSVLFNCGAIAHVRMNKSNFLSLTELDSENHLIEFT